MTKWMRASVVGLILAFVAECGCVQAQDSFSAWDVQFLYGTSFQEPEISSDIPKALLTFENAAAWNWGSSYFFVDCLRSFSKADSDATEVYAEWYPSFSLRHMTGRGPGTGFIRDVSLTPAVNAGTRSTGPQTLVFLPGVTIDLTVPHFKYLTLQALAYIDRSDFNGEDFGAHATSFQITPSWSLPFRVGKIDFTFDGFGDYIGKHGVASSQILLQPQFKFDLSAAWHRPGKVLVGVEWQVWRNKYGVQDLNESVPQALVFWNL